MIHWSCLKSACNTCSSVGKIAGMLEISNPNMRHERHTADKTIAFRRVNAEGMVRPLTYWSANEDSEADETGQLGASIALRRKLVSACPFENWMIEYFRDNKIG